jgi:pimeloyl-ACP methyl ester carboxylesterase
MKVRTRGLLLVSAGVALVAAALGPGTASAGTDGLRVGGLTLTRCGLGVAPDPSWCGRTDVPLDYLDPTAGTITVGFGWVPASGRSVGTVVAMEGGPGYPSTGTTPDFLAMLGPLHADHDLLVVDARGTGRSTLLDCAPLQAYTGSTATDFFRALVRGCGDQLDHTWRRADGTWVHAADLFGTANIARDLADVIGRLGVGPVDLYGDSYGSWFAQVFMARYPALLRSVTLDSSYEVRDLDPWYLTSVQTARTAFDATCRRSLDCSAQAPGSVWARIGSLAAALRAHPVSGWTTGTDAAPQYVTVDIRALVDLVNDAGYDYAQYRTLDAAGRALLEHGDAKPLLRQWAQDLGWDDGDYYGPVDVYTDGIYYAVACTDYPQLFDMHAAPAARRQQLAAAVQALPAGTFAPFSTAEWLQVNQYTEAYTACLDWPAPVHQDPSLPSATAPLDPGGVPVMLMNGDLDSLTPAPGGAHVAAQIGPAARAVVAANMVHLVALDDRYGCGASIYRRFVTRPDRLGTLDVSCLTAIPEVHVVGSYPLTEQQVFGATPVAGSATVRERRLAAVAVAVAGDAAFRYNYVDAYADRGMRGGSTGYRPGPQGEWIRATLRHYRWVDGVTVDGVVSVRVDALAAHGTVTVADGGGAPVTVSLSWTTTGPHAVATARIGSATLTLPAP